MASLIPTPFRKKPFAPYAFISQQMKPMLSVVAHIYVGLRKFKDACARISLKPATNCITQGCNLYVAYGLLLGCCTIHLYATEIVFKFVDNSFFIAADSKGSEGIANRTGVDPNRSTTFGTCKLLDIGDGKYFAFAGRVGGDLYNIREAARQLSAGTVSEAAVRFAGSLATPMAVYAQVLKDANEFNFTSIAFFGIEEQKPVSVKVRFDIQNQRPSAEPIQCPPNCGRFTSLGDRGELLDWATRNPAIYDLPPADQVECLVRAAIPISNGAVGGDISVAKLDAGGLTWIKKGACEKGAVENRTELRPDPPPCALGRAPQDGARKKN